MTISNCLVSLICFSYCLVAEQIESRLTDFAVEPSTTVTVQAEQKQEQGTVLCSKSHSAASRDCTDDGDIFAIKSLLDDLVDTVVSTPTYDITDGMVV